MKRSLEFDSGAEHADEKRRNTKNAIKRKSCAAAPCLCKDMWCEVLAFADAHDAAELWPWFPHSHMLSEVSLLSAPSLRDVAAAYPRLQSLTIHHLHEAIAIGDPGDLRNLHTLNCTGCDPNYFDGLFQALHRAGARLRRANLWDTDPNCSDSHFLPVLADLFADTLEHLEIGGTQFVGTALARMHKLHTLVFFTYLWTEVSHDVIAFADAPPPALTHLDMGDVIMTTAATRALCSIRGLRVLRIGHRFAKKCVYHCVAEGAVAPTLHTLQIPNLCNCEADHPDSVLPNLRELELNAPWSVKDFISTDCIPPGLHALTIQHAELAYGDFESIAKFSPRLHTLNLVGNHPCDTSLRVLHETLHETLTHLDVSFNHNLGNVGALDIGTLFPNLRHFSMSCCLIKDDTACAMNLRAGLRFLDLSDNEISEVGAASIVASECAATLETLCLDSNNIRARGIQTLLDRGCMPRLHTLSVANNRDKQAQCAAHPIRGSSVLPALRVLDLSNTPFNDHTIAPIIETLGPQLDQMMIASIDVGAKTVRLITKHMKRLRILALPFSRYRSSSKAHGVLERAVQKMVRTLPHLYRVWNWHSHEAIWKLCQ